MTRSARRQRRTARRTPTQTQQGMRQLTEAVKNLAVVTQTRQIPDKPDRWPMKIPRRPQIMTFTRTTSVGTITAALTETYGAFQFTLDSLPSYTDFTSLFDQYRIAQITLRFIPVTAQFGASSTASNFPDVHTAIDYDDASTPASVDTIRQYGTHMVSPYNVYFERVLTPRYAVASYSGAFTSYAQAPVYSWIDSASPSVQYYGVKWATTPVTTVSGSFILMNVEATYVIQCKSTI